MGQFFKRGSAVFNCCNCGRATRDTNGENGKLELCEDCYEGTMQENGYSDTDHPAEKAEYKRGMDHYYQQAVNKGGTIEGYAKQ